MTLRSFDAVGWASRIMGEVFHPKHMIIISQRFGETPRFKKRDNVLRVDNMLCSSQRPSALLFLHQMLAVHLGGLRKIIGPLNPVLVPLGRRIRGDAIKTNRVEPGVRITQRDGVTWQSSDKKSCPAGEIACRLQDKRVSGSSRYLQIKYAVR